MGDNLAELLYTAWRSAQDDPSAHPSWGNVEATVRGAWEAVATAARRDAASKVNDEVQMLRDANAAWQRRDAEMRKRWDQP